MSQLPLLGIVKLAKPALMRTCAVLQHRSQSLGFEILVEPYRRLVAVRMIVRFERQQVCARLRDADRAAARVPGIAGGADRFEAREKHECCATPHR